MTRIFVINDEDLSSIENISASEENGSSNLSKNLDDVEGKTLKVLVRNGEENNSNHFGPSKNIAERSSKTSNKDNVIIKHSRTSSITTIKSCISINETPPTETSRQLVATNISLEIEKKIHQDRALERNERLKAILRNENVSLSFKECVIYLIGITLIGFSSTISLSLIPAHDVVQFPEYWYELLFQGPSGPLIWGALNSCVSAGFLLNVDCVLRMKNVFMILLMEFLHLEFMIVSSYYLWTTIFDYQWPMPHFGLILTFWTHIFDVLVIWIRFPLEYRKDGKFRKRFMILCSYVLFRMVLFVIYLIIYEYIETSREDYQPLVALAFPITREITVWIGSKLIAKCSNGDNKSAEIFFKYSMAVSHTIMMCYVIGSYTKATTSWTLMGVDFSINVLISLWIVWKKKFYPSNVEAQMNLLTDLAINELVEFHAPLSYILVIAVTYHGPNGSIFGNVMNGYWKYKAIENIESTLSNMMVFFVVDFSSTLLTGGILWFACQINLWNLFADLQREFRVPFCVILGCLLVLVRKNIYQTF